MGFLIKLGLVGAALLAGGSAVYGINANSPDTIAPPDGSAFDSGTPAQTVSTVPLGVSCWKAQSEPQIPSGQTAFSFGEAIGALNTGGLPGFEVSPGELVYGTETQFVDSSGTANVTVNVYGKYNPKTGQQCQGYSNYFIDPFKIGDLSARGLVVRSGPVQSLAIPASPAQTGQGALVPERNPQANSDVSVPAGSQNGEDGLPPLPPKIPYDYPSAILPTWQTVSIGPSWLSRLERFAEIPGALNFNGNGGTYDEWEGACHVARTLQNMEEFEQILGENYFTLGRQMPDGLTDPETGKTCSLFHPLSRYGNAEILDAYLRNDSIALGVEVERYRRETGQDLSGLLSETSSGMGLDEYYRLSEASGLPVVLLLAIGETEHHNRGGNTFQCSLGTNPQGRESFDCALNHILGDISQMAGRYGGNGYAEGILAYNRGKSGGPMMIDALNALP